ncbi:MAG: NTP transferase domain-containing protein [Hellea sp.]|nr:NTP transferase domain-containing protein [Hellea sp.]
MKSSFDSANISVLILAGQREGEVDPLCAMAGVERKAMIPICGRPMLEYPIEALKQAGLRTPFHVSGFRPNKYADLTEVPSGRGPADSTVTAIETGISYPVLVTTCDSALLSREMVDSFVSQAMDTGADFCAGLAEKRIIQPAYPDVKRTYLNFKGSAVSGCNLFWVANENGLEAIRFWKRAQNFRKQPIRLAAKVGIIPPLLYIFRQLTLDGAFRYAAKRLGITAKPVLIPIAEAAIDVDKPSDLELVEQIMAGRAA